MADCAVTFLTASTGQGAFGEICVVVGDDVVWYAVSNCDIGNESHSSRTVQFLDWLRFYPLGELVHCDK